MYLRRQSHALWRRFSPQATAARGGLVPRSPLDLDLGCHPLPPPLPLPVASLTGRAPAPAPPALPPLASRAPASPAPLPLPLPQPLQVCGLDAGRSDSVESIESAPLRRVFAGGTPGPGMSCSLSSDDSGSGRGGSTGSGRGPEAHSFPPLVPGAAAAAAAAAATAAPPLQPQPLGGSPGAPVTAATFLPVDALPLLSATSAASAVLGGADVGGRDWGGEEEDDAPAGSSNPPVRRCGGPARVQDRGSSHTRAFCETGHPQHAYRG